MRKITKNALISLVFLNIIALTVLKPSETMVSEKSGVIFTQEMVKSFDTQIKNGKLGPFTAWLWSHDLNTCDSSKKTLLHHAVELSAFYLSKELIDRKASLKCKDHNDNTPLHSACIKNELQLFQILLAAGAELNVYNQEGLTPFHIAVYKDNEKLYRSFFEQKFVPLKTPDLDAVTLKKGNTCLHIAAARGNDALCSFLLKHGAKLSILNNGGKAALDLALEGGHISAAKLIEKRMSALIKRGIVLRLSFVVEQLFSEYKDPSLECAENEDLRDILHLACASPDKEIDLETGLFLDGPLVSAKSLTDIDRSEQKKIVNYLLKKVRLNSNMKDQYGRTPLHCALEWGRDHCSLLLIGQGAPLGVPEHIEPDKWWRSPLYLAVAYNRGEVLTELLEKIFSQTTRKNFVDHCQRLVPCALDHTSTKSLEILLKFFSDKKIALQDLEITDCLHRACAQGDENICRILLDAFPCIDYMIDPEKAKKLYAHKGERNYFFESGTELHYAVFAGNEAVCRVLIDRKASLVSKTPSGRSALALACERNHESLVDYLLMSGALIDSLSLEVSSAPVAQKLLERVDALFSALSARQKILYSERDPDRLLTVPDSQGKTLLHKAVEKIDGEKSALFLAYGAHLADQDAMGRTALHYVCLDGDVDDKIRLQGTLKTLQVLLNHATRSIINLPDNAGKTALHYVAQTGDHGYLAARMLVEAGADCHKKSSGFFGNTPFKIAQSTQSTKLLKLFLEKRN